MGDSYGSLEENLPVQLSLSSTITKTCGFTISKIKHGRKSSKLPLVIFAESQNLVKICHLKTTLGDIEKGVMITYFFTKTYCGYFNPCPAE